MSIPISKATLKTIKRFPIDTNAIFYDDAVAIGLRNKLHDLEVEYNAR